MTSARQLPEFVAPMLATLGELFDSPEFLYEVKWDGMRTLAYVGERGLRLVNRHRHDVTASFPEMTFLGGLEPGVVVDGELVVATDGVPDFGAVMGRRHARGTAHIAALARRAPATFVAFDLLYADWAPLLEQPLSDRRARLARAIGTVHDPKLVLSEGIIGQGATLFAQVEKQRLEGIVAKRLDSPYRPGQRTSTWIKVKCRTTTVCAILGFEPNGSDDLKSLVVGMERDGVLRCVGQVGSGISDAQRRELNAWLWSHRRERPLVPCDVQGPRVWVDPGLYCTVSYLELTGRGSLRGPVFHGLIADP